MHGTSCSGGVGYRLTNTRHLALAVEFAEEIKNRGDISMYRAQQDTRQESNSAIMIGKRRGEASQTTCQSASQCEMGVAVLYIQANGVVSYSV